MTIYEVDAEETVYYTLFVEANSDLEAEDMVKQFGGDLDSKIVDADYFEVTQVIVSTPEEVFNGLITKEDCYE